MQGVLTRSFVQRISLIPKAATAAAHIPIREVIHNECLEFTPSLVEIPINKMVVI